MNFDIFNKGLFDKVFMELSYLKDQGLLDSWKFLDGGTMSEGKSSTLYVGDARKTKLVTDYLERLFGKQLWMHENSDDIQFSDHIIGRFEVFGAQNAQYVIQRSSRLGDLIDKESGGLSEPSEVGVRNFKTFDEKYREIHKYFSEVYGAFYNGAFSHMPNLPEYLKD